MMPTRIHVRTKHFTMANENVEPCGVLSTEAEFDAALSESFERPLVLLKHSEWCNLSQSAIAVARGELETWAKEVGCRIVVVQNHRALSDTIARRLGIRHETPQVVVIRNGHITWHAAHFEITTDALRRAIGQT
jgi:bacillithiol system protein YtxJ